MADLPVAGEEQSKDVSHIAEDLLWNGNLMVFGLALAGLLLSLWQASLAGALTALVVMAVTFIAGERFSAKVPNVYLGEFEDALKTGRFSSPSIYRRNAYRRSTGWLWDTTPRPFAAV